MVFFQVKIFLLLVWFVREVVRQALTLYLWRWRHSLGHTLSACSTSPVCYQERQLLAVMCRIQNHRHRPETVSRTHSLSSV